MLKQTATGRRNRGFEATDLIDAFTALERQLAGPDADTVLAGRGFDDVTCWIGAPSWAAPDS